MLIKAGAAQWRPWWARSDRLVYAARLVGHRQWIARLAEAHCHVDSIRPVKTPRCVLAALPSGRRVVLTAFALLLLAAQPGCSNIRQNSVFSERGRPQWRRLVSASMQLLTDQPADKARSLAHRLERERMMVTQALDRLLGVHCDVADKQFDVVVLSRVAELEGLVGPRNRAFRMARLRGLDPFDRIVLTGGGEDRFRFGLALRALQACVPGAPAWLVGGVGQMFSGLSTAGPVLTVGRKVCGKGGQRNPGVKDILTVKELPPSREDAEWFYRAAGRLVELLSLTSQERLEQTRRLVAAIREGTPAPRAWEIAFGSLSLDALDRSVDSAETVSCLRDLGPIDRAGAEEMAEELLTPADVRLLWASMTAQLDTDDGLRTAIRHAEEALRLQPKRVDALWRIALAELFLGSTEAALSHAEEALAIAPQSAFSHILVAAVLLERRADDGASATRVRRLCDDAAALASSAADKGLVANLLFRSGRFTEAESVADAALVLDASCLNCLDALLRSAGELRHLTRVFQAARQLILVEPDPTRRQALVELLEMQ